MNNNIDKVSKIVCKIGDMIIKHTANRKLYNKKLGKYEGIIRKVRNGSTKAGVNGLSSIYIGNSFDKVIVEASSPIMQSKDVYLPPPSISIGYGDFTNLKIVLDEVKTWFELEEYRNNLFIYSKDGKPISINSKYNNLNIQFKSHGYLNNSKMQIEPYVISNNINIESYPGILIRGQTGIIGRCSVTEFYELRMILLELVKNLYQNSLLLSILGGMCEENETNSNKGGVK